MMIVYHMCPFAAPDVHLRNQLCNRQYANEQTTNTQVQQVIVASQNSMREIYT